MAIIWIALGLVMLTAGAEALVRGAVRLALAVRLSPLIIGLTVVAYGTSAPELAVSMKAGMMGQADISLGNVVGSNTFNVLFILGISALIVPLVASRRLVRIDVPVMIAVSLLTWWLALDGSISHMEGALLVAGALIYTVGLIGFGRRLSQTEIGNSTTTSTSTPTPTRCSLFFGILLVGIGLGALVLGARWLVDGATELARAFGVSDLLIGLTIVAVGTSLPEVATSIVAAIRGQRDIAIGNVVGSNIFNLLSVLGATAVVSRSGVAVSSAALNFDIPIMVAVAVVCLPIFFTGGRISRWEGAVFLAYYGAYIVFLIFAATRHDALHPFSTIMIWFAIPITLLGLLVSVVVYLKTSKADCRSRRS